MTTVDPLHRWRAAVQADLENCASAVVYVEETEQVSTVLCLYDYYRNHYSICGVTFSGYRGDTGSRVFEIKNAESAFVTLRCKDLLPIPYRGNLLLIASLDGAREEVLPHGLLQISAIFRFADGSLSTIHGQGQLAQGFNARPYHCFDIHRDFQQVSLLIQNHSLSEQCSTSAVIFDEQGARVGSIDAPLLEPLAFCFWPIAAAIRAAFDASLRSRRLSLTLRQTIDSRRPLYRIELRDAFAMNHGSYIYSGNVSLPQTEGLRVGMICCGIPLESDSPYSITMTVDNHNPPLQRRLFDAIVFDHNGGNIGRIPGVLELEPAGVGEISPHEIRRRAGLPPEFRGHAILVAQPDAAGFVLAELQFNLSIRPTMHGKVAGCMISGYIQNTAPAPGSGGEGFRRNRTFCPVVVDRNTDTVIYVFNNSSSLQYTSPARAEFVLHGEDGTVATVTTTIAANRMFRLSVREWLSNSTTMPWSKSIVGWLICKSTDAQLPGFYVMHDSGGRWADLDHLFGG